MKPGKVYLVGAGPGDPGLITVKGLECIKKADVVIYDRLVDERLIDALPDIEKIYVGKSPDRHWMEQESINQLLVSRARQGKTVVRLKGGDPFVLGRGGEEAEILAKNQIPFEIVPGVTSAIAVPAYAGIPVTHRGISSSFAVVTGHKAMSDDNTEITWDRLSTGAVTLVFLMGVRNIKHIVDRLLENGRPPSTPVAVITSGTTSSQRTLLSTLESVVAQMDMQEFEPPAVVVIGEVVNLREQLRWFDNNPLFGKRILITRAKQQINKFSQILINYGAVPVEMPAIEIKPTANIDELDKVIRRLNSYQWVIFTSVNGVQAFFKRLHALNLDVRQLKDVQVGVIGPATAEALGTFGLRADYMPAKYTCEDLLNGLKSMNMNGCRVLLPRADIADEELAGGIARLGAEVEEVAAYVTEPSTEVKHQARQALEDGEIDIITFTSSSTVTGLLAILNGELQLINKAVIACIGPKTAARAAQAGIRVDVVAQRHTIMGLVEAMEQYFQQKGEG